MSLTRVFLIFGLAVAVSGCTAGTTGAAPAKPAQTVHKTLTITEPVPANTTVRIQNLVGHVAVRQGGRQLQVSATVVAGGKDTAAAQALADTVKLTVQRVAGTLTVHVHYPVDRHQRFHYIPTPVDANRAGGLHVPGITIGGRSTSSTGIRYQAQNVSVYRGINQGVPLHADLVVSLPAGARADIRNHVGPIEAEQLEADLTLDNDSGDIHAHAVRGRLTVKADSGDVKIADLRGPLAVDTDAGDVEVANIQGSSDIQADAGDIRARNIHGHTLTFDADAGDIHVDNASGTVQVDADAGDVRLENLGTVPHLDVDSDMGDIDLGGDLSGVVSFKIDTDAGDITLVTAQPPAVRLDIKGSQIHVQWPDLHAVQSSRGRFTGSIGPATGQGIIRTDAGDVRLTR